MKIAKPKSGQRQNATRLKGPGFKTNAMFVETLSSVMVNQNDILFAALWNDVRKAEDRVRHSLAYPDWIFYRKSIHDFLYFVLQSGYKTLDRAGFSVSGASYTHTVVTAINEKIHEVGMIFLQDSQDKITLLARLDELRGMLLDLYT